MTPLHRACKSRASLEKVVILVEAAPDVLFWRDWCGNTPLGLADRMDHRLGDIVPEVVGLLELSEEMMQIGSDDTQQSTSDGRQRAGELLMRCRFIYWQNGISMTFSHNTQLFNLMGIPTILTPEFLSLFTCSRSVSDEHSQSEITGMSNINGTNRLNALYSLLKHRPWLCEVCND